jgi:hypothetical protein
MWGHATFAVPQQHAWACESMYSGLKHGMPLQAAQAVAPGAQAIDALPVVCDAVAGPGASQQGHLLWLPPEGVFCTCGAGFSTRGQLFLKAAWLDSQGTLAMRSNGLLKQPMILLEADHQPACTKYLGKQHTVKLSSAKHVRRLPSTI